MEKMTSRILKAEQVKLQGQYHVDAGVRLQNSAGASKTVAGAPQARIVENNADYAIVEITCRCGGKTRVRCDYSHTKTK